jgi:hypothetical protein
MTETKELGKYEIIPSSVQLNAIAEYFRKNQEKDGRIDFTIRMLFESPIAAPHFGSISYLNGVVTYLSNEGWLERLSTGHAGNPSTYNAKSFLDNLPKVVTREKAGRARPIREEYEMKAAVQPEVEIVRKLTQEDTVETKPVQQTPTPAVTANNADVLRDLKGAMNDIIGYLQSFPAEMSGHLNSIAERIEVTDEKLVEKLRFQIKSLEQDNIELQNKNDEIMKEVDGFMEEIDALTEEKKSWEQKEMDLTEEVQRLNTQLEEVGRNLNYNKHHVYRQRNLIMDEVDRMINTPAWTMKQNSVNHRNTIESKLNEIMSEIGIDGNE